MKKILIAILLLASQFSNAAEPDEIITSKYKNNILVNMSSLILVNQISMNYERTLYDGQDIDINGHAGIGYMSVVNLFGEDKNKINVPFGFNVITGNTNSHFDLNIGGIYSSNFLYPDVTFGYRYQSQNEPFIFRTFLGTTGIGISFGVRF